jgi:hypothetical protein
VEGGAQARRPDHHEAPAAVRDSGVGDVAGNVEIVRRYYAVLDGALERNLLAPDVSFSQSPLAGEVLALLDPAAE